MPRPLQGSSRVIKGRVYLRLKQHQWAVGPVLDWPPVRIEAALAEAVRQYKDNPATWQPPTVQAVSPEAVIGGARFQEVATVWLDVKDSEGLDENTMIDLRARVSHLLSYFGDMRMSEINRDHLLGHKLLGIKGYRAYKTDEHRLLVDLKWRYKSGDIEGMSEAELKAAKHPNRVGLSDAGINRTITTLAAIIDYYRESSPAALAILPLNPARSTGVKKKIKGSDEKERTHLEANHVDYLFAAAKSLEAEARYDRKTLGRFEMIAVLACTGMRISEMCDLRRRDVHFDEEQIYIRDSKTGKSRSPWMSPWLSGVLREWMYERQTKWTDRDAPLFPNAQGKVRDTARFRDRILYKAVKRADDLLEADNKTAMPEHITPHALRRTYITFAQAAKFEMHFVMKQVGHEDAEMTAGVYSKQLLKRNDPRIVEWVGSPDLLD